MATFETALIHLDPQQKRRLARLAKQRRTSLASEVRSAIECYLLIGGEHIDPEELASVAKSARKAVATMTLQAKRANRFLETTLRELRARTKGAT